MSADGSTVVGVGYTDLGSEAIRWTRAGGLQPLGGLASGPGGRFDSAATGVSADGSVVVGTGVSGTGATAAKQAFRWTAAGGMQSLGVLSGLGQNGETPSSFAADVSADGSVVVGTSAAGQFAREPFRWTAAGGMQRLTGPNRPTAGDARAISADGLTIVGSTSYSFRWTQAGGTQLLVDPGGGGPRVATDVSADGSTVVGIFPLSEGDEGEYYVDDYRWTAAGGVRPIRSPGDSTTFRNDYAYAVSADGQTVLGAQGNFAYISTADGRVRRLQDVLGQDYGLDLTGWQLEVALDISLDGSTIVGTGINPAGQREGWVAVIPEPSAAAAALLGSGVVGLARRRRRPLSPAR